MENGWCFMRLHDDRKCTTGSSGGLLISLLHTEAENPIKNKK